jgi:uncharacterized lipoprotein NlpE involved in copper resistance
MKLLSFTTLALCLFLATCTNKPEETPTEKTDAESKPRLVGRVASIPADRTFVLIQSYGTWTVETGSILTTQGPEGRAANLLATGEKLGQYAAADIRTGTLEIGDGVYTIAKAPAMKETDTEADTETAEKSEALSEEKAD